MSDPHRKSPVLLPSSIATACATVVGNHFDIVKTRQMMGRDFDVWTGLREVAATEGKWALLSGLKQAVLAGVAGNACYFLLYEASKQKCADVIGPLGFGISAFFSRAAAVALMIPVEVLRTRAYAGSAASVQNVSLAKGLKTQVWRDVFWSTICWQVYESTRPALISLSFSPSFSSVLSGVIGGLLATVLTHPLDLLKTKMQLGEIEGERTVTGLKRLWETQGSEVLRRGLMAHCMRTTANMSVFIYVYTTLREACSPRCHLA